MPLYQYGCCDCNEKFDLLRPIGQRDEGTTCPSCGSDDTKRNIATLFAYLRRNPSRKVPQEHEQTHSDVDHVPRRPPFINLANGHNITINNMTITDWPGTAVKVQNVEIEGRDLTLRGCITGIDATDSHLRIDGLRIE